MTFYKISTSLAKFVVLKNCKTWAPDSESEVNGLEEITSKENSTTDKILKRNVSLELSCGILLRAKRFVENVR